MNHIPSISRFAQFRQNNMVLVSKVNLSSLPYKIFGWFVYLLNLDKTHTVR